MARKMHSKTVWPSSRSAPLPRHVSKVGRNDPCPCGSGRKYKICHESEGSAYLAKLAREQDKIERKELRSRLRKGGAPWYRRIFFLK